MNVLSIASRLIKLLHVSCKCAAHACWRIDLGLSAPTRVTLSQPRVSRAESRCRKGFSLCCFLRSNAAVDK